MIYVLVLIFVPQFKTTNIMTTTSTTATFKVTYSGNSTRFTNFEEIVNAKSQREAVERVYSEYLNENYFPQDDGSVKDCDGHTIADNADDIYFEYDGGYFYAEEID